MFLPWEPNQPDDLVLFIIPLLAGASESSSSCLFLRKVLGVGDAGVAFTGAFGNLLLELAIRGVAVAPLRSIMPPLPVGVPSARSRPPPFAFLLCSSVGERGTNVVCTSLKLLFWNGDALTEAKPRPCAMAGAERLASETKLSCAESVVRGVDGASVIGGV